MLLWVVFFAAAVLSIGLGSVLSFHWLRYAMNPIAPIVAVISFAAVAFACLSVMFGVVTIAG